MNRGLLRLVAVTTMVIDHVAAVYDLGIEYRFIGRAALPAFLLLLVDGMQRTHDLPGYGLRLATFGIVAQPLCVAVGFGSTPNIMFTLAAAVGVCANRRLWFLGGAMVVSELLTGVHACDYGTPVLLCAASAAIGQQKYWPYWIALGVFLGHTWPVFTWGGALFGAAAVGWLVVVYGVSRLETPLIRIAERGAAWYWFYPGHLGLLVSLRELLNLSIRA